MKRKPCVGLSLGSLVFDFLFVMRDDEKRAWVNPWYYNSDPVIFYLQWCLTSYSYGTCTTMEATHSNNMKSHGRL